jgi:hypothetical protein
MAVPLVVVLVGWWMRQQLHQLLLLESSCASSLSSIIANCADRTSVRSNSKEVGCLND